MCDVTGRENPSMAEVGKALKDHPGFHGFSVLDECSHPPPAGSSQCSQLQHPSPAPEEQNLSVASVLQGRQRCFLDSVTPREDVPASFPTVCQRRNSVGLNTTGKRGLGYPEVLPPSLWQLLLLEKLLWSMCPPTHESHISLLQAHIPHPHPCQAFLRVVLRREDLLPASGRAI